MQRVLRPFEIFQKMNTSVFIWLNGEPTAIGKRGEAMWNKAKYRIATDGAINEISKRKEEVKWPDVICGDFDSLDKNIDIQNANLVHLPDQNHTDLTKSITWCLEQKKDEKWSFEQIVVLGGLNGRLDHTMSTLSTLIHFIENPIPVIVLDAKNLVISVPEGESSKIEVDLEMMSKMCGVIPITQRDTIVTSHGLKYEMDNMCLEFGKLISSSNQVTTNQVTLKSTAPLIFCIELLNEIVI